MSSPRSGASLASREGLWGQLPGLLRGPHRTVSRAGPPPSSVSPPPASKGNGLGTICLWSWSQTWGARGKRPTLAVVVLARLQWSPTRLAYFSLSTCPGEPPPPHPTPLHPTGLHRTPGLRPCVPAGEGIVLCGDEEGNVWVYDVRHLLTQQPPLPAAPQAPTQVGAPRPPLARPGDC